MEENILNEIAEAEAQAAARKADAQARAAEIVGEAEKSASERQRLAELECAMRRAEGLKKAEQDAEAAYERALADRRRDSVRYAEERLAQAEPFVAEIVRRILK